MKKVRLIAIVAVVALLMQAFGTGSAKVASAQGTTIKIASQSPLSGSQSVLGVAIRNGADLAVQQLKKPIEDLGFKVEFVPYDDQATPDVGVGNAQNIVNDPAIFAVIGHLNSGVAIPSSEVYVKSDLVMVSPANTNPTVTDRGLATVNRVCGRDDIQGAVGATYAHDKLGAKSVYIIHDKTPYGEGLATQFRDTAQSLGMTILGFEGTEEQSNFDTLLTPVAAQNADVLYFGGIYDRGGLLIKQARDKGIKSQYMGGDGLDGSDLVKLGGESAIGTVFTSTAGPASLFPDAKQFIDDYKKTFKTEIVETYSPESYAATQIVLAGIEKAIKDNGGKLPTRKQVSDAVRATKDFKTIIGTITFDANGDPVQATYYIKQVKSADTAKWGTDDGDPLLTSVTQPSPLAAKSMMATMEATAAK